MVIAVALGILIPLHDHTLLFIIMCWSLFIHRWIFLAEHEDKRKVFIKCGLLIVCSIYAYVNGELTMANIWIRPPGILYYHLFFILHELNQSVQSKGIRYLFYSNGKRYVKPKNTHPQKVCSI